MLRKDLRVVKLADLSADEGTLLLCHSARLATDLRRAHGALQAASGRPSWRALQSATMAMWLEHLCSGALLRGEIPPDSVPGVFLNKLQERSLWEQTILTDTKMSAVAAELFDTDGMAQVAMEAGNLSHVWRLTLPEAMQTEEWRAFERWQASVAAICEKNHWCTQTQALAWRIACISRGVTGLPTQIGIAGFMAPDPMLARLLVALETRGVRVFRLELGSAEAAQICRYEFADAQAECDAAARWAAKQLHDYICTSKNSRTPIRIRIAVADLPVRQRMLAAALDAALHPDWVGAAWAGHERDYQIIGTSVLADQPLVNVALSLLQLLVHPRRVAQADFGVLLCACGWSGDVSEADGRAQLEANLRERLSTVTTLDSIHAAVTRLHVELNIPRLFESLSAIVDATKQLRAQSKRQLPSAWAVHFVALLESVGWPGERPCIAAEQAACDALRESLTNLVTLDAMLGRVDSSVVLRHLQRQCRDQIFQAPRRVPAAVEVCSLTDAIAAPVDAMWVMGLIESAWPTVPRPNPLLPAEMQRRAGVNAARADSLASQAQAIQTLWRHGADEVVFSSATREGERELRASPLIATIKKTTLTSVVAVAETASKSDERLERFTDALAPAVTDAERVRGGTHLLQAQAICPAWGFYQYRLGSGVLPAPTDGLDAKARGALLHSALELFWRDRAQSDLLQMNAATRADEVSAAVENALVNYERHAIAVLPPRLRQLEHQRLVALLQTWLDLEAQRRPFRVLACEEKHNLNIEGLPVRVIIDRIDELDDGRLIIIDYKSGRKVSANTWSEPRISEPQLPIYAALAFPDRELAAVALARVTSDNPAFIGIAQAADLLPLVKALDDQRKHYPADEFADWNALRERWAERIKVVAAEVKDGCAAVVFDSDASVAYCEVLPLLRVAERRAQFEQQKK